MRLVLLTTHGDRKLGGVPQYWQRMERALAVHKIQLDRAHPDTLDLKTVGPRDETLFIVDNQDALKVPAGYPAIAVQHGCAAEHAKRTGNAGLLQTAALQAQAAKRPRIFWVGCSEYAAWHCKQHYDVSADRIIYGAVDCDSFFPGERQIRKDPPIPLILHDCKDDNKGRAHINAVAGALGEWGDVRQVDAPPAGMPDELRRGDIFLCLSASEGLPTIAMEALATDLLVVSTNVGIFWPKGYAAPGYVFPWEQRGDSAAVGAAIQAAWKRRRAYEGRPYAKRWWNMSVFGQKWIEALAVACDKLGVQ